MATRSDVVREARTWIGTPWRHQGNLKGVACDCAGLLRGVCLELGLVPLNAAKYNGYAREPDGVSIMEASLAFMRKIPESQLAPGDVAVFRIHRLPQHFAIIGDYPHGGLSMIHSFKTGVGEHYFDPQWRKKLVGTFALRGLEE
jgi:NlpC/P60 family putative phage cell wall peptidase